jgi:nucleoside-diphosphate-sugar epimerase
MTKKKKILVTGGAGFIGSWVSLQLEQFGYQPFVIDDFSTGEEVNLSKLNTGCMEKVDITDESALNKLPWQEFDGCYHLAAKGDVHESIEQPGIHFDTNTKGTFYLLEKCRAFQIPFLMTSTCMVYGLESIPENGINENCDARPVSPYAGSKLAAEYMCMSYHHTYGLPVKIARPFNTYGPHQKTTNREGGVIPVFIEKVIQGKNLKVFGEGTQTRDFLYVEDCADFLIKFMQAENVPMILNAGSGKTISVNELAAKIASDKVSVERAPHPHPQSEIQRLLCDSKLAQQTLKWEPKTSLDEGIKRNFEWLRNQND